MSYKAFPLWEFQEEDITRFEEETAVLLAWQMGTGKSPSAMERDRRIRLSQGEDIGGKTLVVAPLGTHVRWKQWFDDNTPLTTVRIDPKHRYDFLKRPAHVYIVHWEALRLLPGLRKVRWQHIIADEVQKAKSKDAKQTRALKKIPCKWKTALSGTPATNRPQDLWSVLNWLYPKIWTSFNRFLDDFVDYQWNDEQPGREDEDRKYRVFAGPKNTDELHRRIAPYYSRHLKNEQCCEHHPEGVMPWLPKKTWDDVWIDLQPKQRRAYDAMAKDMLAWIGDHDDEPLAAPLVINQLHRLQQLALGYLEPFEVWDKEEEVWITKYKMVEPSAKLDAVVERLMDNPDQQVLIFSQWKQPLYMLGERLDKLDISHRFYTGDQNANEREENKSAFVSGVARILLGTIGAGGTGVDDLQMACSNAFFLDRSWSPADNEQAEDRLHRGGQKSVVQITDFVARNTVDLGRKQRLETKWEWLRELLGDTKRKVA